MTDYENRLIALGVACATVRIAAEGLQAHSDDTIDDSRAAPTTIAICRRELLAALDAAPELRDIFTVSPER